MIKLNNKRLKFSLGFFRFVEFFTTLCKIILFKFNNRKIVKNITILSLLTGLLILGSFTNLNKPSYKVDRIVIDAGHGGKDGGTFGAISKEKDVALQIATELGTIIKEYLPDVEVIYTRADDNFIELDERANIANKNGADLFISIHCNAVEYSNKVKGTETWVMGLHKSETNLNVAKRENSVILMEENYSEKYEGFDPNDPASHILFSLYQNAYLSNSLNLAEKIEFQFKKRVGRNSRGVKQAGFVVLYKSSMPSVLVETGFLSNPSEERYLNDDLGQTYIASGIFRAVRDYKVEIESMN
ncbi:N-acetylmuramoyl-L-alanine amidase [Marivirga atlantica]|jgi:N-acetylmuramoyl-L-alanine amidase|uniref:N-acetylmuramoyl-L-alanine amidase n=1 Tax=Marivirga atlantica TaxID=1548457 RepID=A0A937A7G5_9BACT|nr:N-acetylmuramoyl-L-alanine amidase [Marivirga atlantica]